LKGYDGGVRTSLLSIIVCPDCRQSIKLVQGDPSSVDKNEVVNGMLECLGCGRSFVIRRRIPQLLPKHLAAAQQQEMEARDEQVEEYDSNIPLMLFGLVEMPFTFNQLDLNSSQSLLEAGCGTGRMSEKLAKQVKSLVSVDFSLKSLMENEIKLEASGLKNFHLIQADLCNLPLKDGLFDRALSCQVLEHIPTDELRKKALSEISRTVKPGSTVVISAYQYSRFTKDKEGEHDGGIPYFRFTEEELTELLAASFTLNSVSGLLVYLYVAQCIRPEVPVSDTAAQVSPPPRY